MLEMIRKNNLLCFFTSYFLSKGYSEFFKGGKYRYNNSYITLIFCTLRIYTNIQKCYIHLLNLFYYFKIFLKSITYDIIYCDKFKNYFSYKEGIFSKLLNT